MYASIQVNKVRAAIRKHHYLDDVANEKKNHCALNNDSYQLSEMTLHDFTWQAEDRMKNIVMSKYTASKITAAPIFTTKAQFDEYRIIECMSKEEIIHETYVMLDQLQPQSSILQEAFFKKEIKGKSKKAHVQFYLKIMDLVQSEIPKNDEPASMDDDFTNI